MSALWWGKISVCAVVSVNFCSVVLMQICLRGAKCVLNCVSSIVLLYDGIRYNVRTLVVGGRKVRCRAAGYACGDEGCCSTGSVIWCLEKGWGGRVKRKLVKRVLLAWVLFWNELPFLLEGLDIELLVRGQHFWVIKGRKQRLWVMHYAILLLVN